MNDELFDVPAFESAAELLRRDLPREPDQLSNGHRWWKSSGTADECRNCDLIRYYIDDAGSPTRAKSTQVLYGFPYKGSPLAVEPACRPGLVYFIGASRRREVKIGFTSAPVEVRLAALQTGNPLKLRVLATVRGNEYLERELHQRFGSDRLEGEWFARRRGGELDLYIKRLTRKAR